MMDEADRKTAAEGFGCAKWVCAGCVAMWGYGWVFYHVLLGAQSLRGSGSDAILAGIVFVGLTGLVFRYLQRRFER